MHKHISFNFCNGQSQSPIVQHILTSHQISIMMSTWFRTCSIHSIRPGDQCSNDADTVKMTQITLNLDTVQHNETASSNTLIWPTSVHSRCGILKSTPTHAFLSAALHMTMIFHWRCTNELGHVCMVQLFWPSQLARQQTSHLSLQTAAG